MACQIIRILTIDVPIQYGPIRVFESEGVEVTQNCQYSWSTDSLCWTQWTDYHNYEVNCKNIESDFYLRVRLFSGFSKISINGLFTKCYSMCLDSGNIFAQNLCSESVVSIYDNLDCALLLQQQMSDAVICMLGLPIYYFRVTPDQTSADFNFKEYVFHNVSSVKYIKMMIPDGTLPSSKPVFTEFDFEWENDWEVELSKTQFAQAFGDTVFPKQRDLVYVPMMKRMYEVNSAYDEKNEGLMWRSTTWKLALVKYNDKTNVDKGDFEDLIDTLTVRDYDDVFGNFEIEEADRESGVNQTASPVSAYNGVSNVFHEDGVRSKITKDFIDIIQKQLNQNSNILVRNMYMPKINVDLEPDKMPVVIYQDKFCYNSFSFSFIITTGNSRKNENEYSIIEIGNFFVLLNGSNLLTLGGTSFQLEDNQSYMVLGTVDYSKFSGDIYVAKHSFDQRLNGKPEYLIPATKRFFDFKNAMTGQVNYNNEWNCDKNPQPITLSPCICGLSNFKLFNRPLDTDVLFAQSCMYVSTHKDLIINDLARPLNDGYGYSLK